MNRKAPWRIYKGRREWALTDPANPWTVLRLCPDGVYGTHSCWATWRQACEAVQRHHNDQQLLADT